MINSPRPNLLRLMPALTISEDENDQGLELLREALAVVEPTRDRDARTLGHRKHGISLGQKEET